MDRRLSPEDLQDDVQAAIEARERRGREEQERAAKQLAEILDAPQSGMSRRLTFNVFGEAENSEQEEDPEE